MRLTITNQLNAHFVDVESPATESAEHDGVRVVIALDKPEGASFATVTCSGELEIATSSSAPFEDGSTATERLLAAGVLLSVPPTVEPVAADVLAAGYLRIDAALREVGAALRWRFNLSGGDAVFKDSTITLETDDRQLIEIQPILQAAMGDDMARIPPEGLGEVADMLHAGAREPLAHQLLREAWNLRHGNPRAALVVGVAAAEVGMKRLIAELVPEARWLVEEVPSPPLVHMARHYLKELPIRVEVASSERTPKHLRTILHAAVEARNTVVHRGAAPELPLRDTLAGIREFLYLLDFYAGEAWAADRLSPRTRAALGIESSGLE